MTGTTIRDLPKTHWNLFLCPECRTIKPTKGRRARGFKAGFRCADCVAKRRESPR